MSREKLRIHNTDLDNLVSNLRGEVGEIIHSWILMRALASQAARLRTGVIDQDMEDQGLATLHLLSDKLNDEVIARLSELAEEKIGQLTFYFASRKLNRFEAEIAAFSRFIRSNDFEKKRNNDISHKMLPEKFTDYKHISIPYRTVLKGLGRALRLMKKIDRAVLGPSAPYLSRAIRHRRYSAMHLVKVGYMLLPYLYLSQAERKEIILKEMAEGKAAWADMDAKIDGVYTTVKANKEWGAFRLGPRLIVLEHYPLQQLSEISTQPPSPQVVTGGESSPHQKDVQTGS